MNQFGNAANGSSKAWAPEGGGSLPELRQCRPGTVLRVWFTGLKGTAVAAVLGDGGQLHLTPTS